MDTGWGGVKGEEASDTCSQVPTCSPFLPTASYQQGVLSATLLYEILLGKATLYAVLVSALVLMAMVRRGQDGAGRLEVTLEMQQHRPRNVETPPGPEVGREEEGVHPHASEDTLPLCDHSGRARAGQEKLGSPENPMAGCWEETCYSSCQWDTLLPLGPQHSWLLVTLTPSLPQVKRKDS